MIDFILLFFLVICAIAAIRMKDLLSTIIILGAYSLIMAVVWTRMNAVDVAFTEASVGAGITTVLLIAALSMTQRWEENGEISQVRVQGGINTHSIISIIVVLITGAVLVYGTLDMPDYGDPDAPSHHHVAKRYIHEPLEESGVINMVTALLANYRGYDTLGETTVIFTAGLSVILLLRRKMQR